MQAAEPPVILPTTISDYTAVEGDLVELQCNVEATPPATIQWMRKGALVTEGTPGVRIEDGRENYKMGENQ